MSTDYCDPEDVSGFMTMLFGDQRLIFNSTSNPTRQEVEAMINTIEDVIDEDLDSTWKATPRTIADEPHKFLGLEWDRYNRKSYSFRTDFGPIIPMVTPTDKFEIWDGGAWVDWLADGELGAGPYDKKFYVDERGRRFFIYNNGVMFGPSTVRVTYRYGYASVPGQIKRLAILLTAIDLMMTQLQFVSLPDGDNNVSREEIIKMWRDEVEAIKNEYQPILVAN